MIDEQTEKLIRLAVSDWCDGKLEHLPAMIVIHSLLYPAEITEDDIRWAMQDLNEKQ